MTSIFKIMKDYEVSVLEHKIILSFFGNCLILAILRGMIRRSKSVYRSRLFWFPSYRHEIFYTTLSNKNRVHSG